MKIDIEDAKYETCEGYIPVFRGGELRAEGSLPEVSLENLRHLIAVGLEVKWFTAGPDRSVVIEFESGEKYLATGFSFGDTGDLTWAFCQFIEEINLGTAKINFNSMAALPHDWVGELPVIPRPQNPLIEGLGLSGGE